MNSRYSISDKNLTEVITEWTNAEHARLHGPGDSVLTDLNAMRKATALPYDDIGNTSVLKTVQHLDRLRMRVGLLQEAEFEPNFTGRTISDCLKLLAGQQIKRLMAVATDQKDFTAHIRTEDLGIPFTVDALLDAEVSDHATLGTLSEEVGLLTARLQGSLQTIAIRAEDGFDWGQQESEMVQAAWLGEVACARMMVVTVMNVACSRGGIDKVPLRTPASDQADAPIIFPFKSY